MRGVIETSVNLTGLVNELRATLGKMEVALGAIADAIVWTGIDGKIQWCNAAFDKLVNLPHILVLNVKLSDLLPLAQAGENINTYFYPNVKILEGDYQATEYEFQQGNRSLILEISGNCFELPEGDRSAVLVIRDITQAKRWEAALSESEAKFRRIVENANDIVSLIDLKGKICYISPNLTNLTGYDPTELEGISFANFIHPEDLPRCIEAFQRVLTTGEKQSGVEYRAKIKDGTWQWQATNLTTTQDINGNLLVISFARIIIEQKQAEEALKRSEQKLQSFVESNVAGILFGDVDGSIKDANDEFLRMIGYTREELDRGEVSWINITPQEWLPLGFV